MIAIVLGAGFGTRMGSLTERTPKTLLPVAGRPLADYLLEQVVDLPGIDRIHFVANARDFPTVQRWAASRRADDDGAGPALEVHDDGVASHADRLGTVGDLAFVLRCAGNPPGALVAGTDNILRFRLARMWGSFREGEASVIPALREDAAAARLSGVPELGPGDRVLRVHEKPDHPPSPYTCPALMCLRATALARVHDFLGEGNAPDDLGAFLTWIAAREPLRAFRIRGRRLHVGSPAALHAADALLRREPVLLDD